FFPRRKSPLQLAALTAALLAGFGLVVTYWSYTYIPWFSPFPALALLAPAVPLARLVTVSGRDADQVEGFGAARVRAREEDALEPHVAFRRPAPDRDTGPHSGDCELRADADHRIVRARHSGIGDRRRPAGQHP